MKDQFVPYEMAVKLKELGFNDPCFATYHNNFHTIIPIYAVFKNGDYLKAPLWQQAFDWFRNKGYGAFVETWINGGVKKFRGRNNYAPLFITDVFDTYEEAREACLLKLIDLI